MEAYGQCKNQAGDIIENTKESKDAEPRNRLGSISLHKAERKEWMSKMSQQTLSGVYPGFPPYLQSMYMQPLLQQCLSSSTSPLLQQCLYPLAQLQQAAYPPYLANTPTAVPGDVDEPNRDTSLSPAAGMVANGEQEEKEDYMAELTREKEVLISRGMTREGSLLLRLLERGE